MSQDYARGCVHACSLLGIKLGIDQANPTENGVGAAVTSVGAGAGLMFGGKQIERYNHKKIREANATLHALPQEQKLRNMAISKAMVADHRAKYGPINTYTPQQVSSGQAPKHITSARPHFQQGGSAGHHLVSDPAVSETVAHELGHATSAHHLGKHAPAIAHFRYNAKRVGVPASFGYGLLQNPDEHSPGQVAALNAAAQVPDLLEEGYASLEGMRKLHPHGYSRATAAKRLVPAFGTYAGKALSRVGLGVGLYEGGRFIQRAVNADKAPRRTV